jgi:preprotein translocase subunit SecF
MIQRAIGVTIGVLVSLVLLVITTSLTIEEVILPLVIGAISAWAWPVVIAFWLGRRAQQRRDGQIESEVQRQLDEEHTGG